MVNKILGIVLLIASGFIYTIERVSTINFETTNGFVPLFFAMGSILFLIGMMRDDRFSTHRKVDTQSKSDNS